MKHQSFRHHYIPQFYSKRWVGEGGELCEFSRPYGVVKPQRKTPKAVGYFRDLYTVTGVPPESQNSLEDKFFRQTDQLASDALDFMLANTSGAADVPARLRSGWSRFLLSLVHRSPERVEQLRAKLRIELATRELETERDAEESTWAVLLERIIDSPIVGTALNAMHWSVVTFNTSAHSLMTSDRPVCMTNGIVRPDGFVALPVSPTQAFLATNTQDAKVMLRRDDAKTFHAYLNGTVVRQAIQYVYATNDRQLKFVENRLRKQVIL